MSWLRLVVVSLSWTQCTSAIPCQTYFRYFTTMNFPYILCYRVNACSSCIIEGIYLNFLEWTFKLNVNNISKAFYKCIHFMRAGFFGWWVGYLGASGLRLETLLVFSVMFWDKLFTRKVMALLHLDGIVKISNMWMKTTHSGMTKMVQEPTKSMQCSFCLSE